jgi:uncharacterized protein (TIGR00725 family)
MLIGLIGGSHCSEETYLYAKKVGENIAKKGGIIVCGGLGGVMEAVCKGAKNAGGTTIGILPGYTKFDANHFVDIPIITGMGIARNVIIVRTADVVVALEGSAGTLSEIAMALNIGKPVVAVRDWSILKQEHLHGDLMYFIDTPDDAAEKATELAKVKNHKKLI